MTTAPSMEMTYFDHDRLRDLIDRATHEVGHHFRDLRHFQLLRHKLETARCMDSSDISPRVVTMGSTVRVQEFDSGEWWTFTLCYPREANIDEDRISILAPIGAAIFGQRVGDVVDWPVPDGSVRIQIRKITYQPESAGILNEPELILH